MKMSVKDAELKYGKEIIAKLLKLPVEPTGRLIYPAFEAEHANMDEFMSEGIEVEDGTLYAYYFQPSDIENLDNCDWVVDNIELV